MKSQSTFPLSFRCLVFFGLIAASLSALTLTGCPGGSGGGGGGGSIGGKNVPAPTDPKYLEAVSAFFTGTVALETSDKERHVPSLKKATELASGEPAAWANLALAYLSTGSLRAEASPAVAKAHELAPNSPEVAIAEGFVLKDAGKFDEALKLFQQVADKQPDNLKVLWLIQELADQAKPPDANKVRQEVFERILKVRPDNVRALTEAIRVAADGGNKEKVSEYITRLGEREYTFSEQARQLHQTMKTAFSKGDLRQVRLAVWRMHNVLNHTPGYQSSAREVTFRSQVYGEPIPYLLAMKNPPYTPAEPDTALKYNPEGVPNGITGTHAFAVPPDVDSAVAIFVSSGGVLRRTDMANSAPLALPTGAARQPPAPKPHYFAAVDFNNDYLTDIAFAGFGGFRLYRQQAGGGFADATAALKLPPAVTNANYTGAWAVDIESDGDLDIMLSPSGGAPLLLQNNGDGTFLSIKSPFSGVASPITAFAWADMDGDGDADPIFADAGGKLVFYRNERSGLFRARTGPTGVGKVVALTAMEATGDATVDPVVLQDDGTVLTTPDKDKGLGWETPITLVKSGITGGVSLRSADLDNNGGLDLIVSGPDKSEVYLSDKDLKYSAPAIPVPVGALTAADLTSDGLLDLVGVAPGGKPMRAIASGSKKYNWQAFTLKRTTGKANEEDRINTFCIGGEAEMRAGLLYQKQTITQPQLHFGLGEYAKVDVARVIWPTGNAQSEFDIAKGPIVAEQRLGGSCPFLYTWDGTKMAFVTDCIWRSPLGLKINAQATAGATQPEDWVKVRGEQLVPKDGFYNVSITGELRETHFFDLVNLMVVDHPEDTEIYVDERFVPTAGPILKVFQTATPQPVTAFGTDGQDVSEIVKERDTKYLDDFGRGQYQGVTKDHWVEVALPDSAPRGKPLYLIAFGWLHPTDSSINVAIGQNKSTPPPSGLSLETPDASGKWSATRPGLGFPAGKVKTIVLRIDDAFKPNAPRRLRLRTNLEIFWDQIQWAEEKPGAPRKIQRLTPETANLRYRGFSKVEAKDASSPELPVSYEQVATTAPMWRDLEGFHTRFGDIKPLLAKVDDRYVIMNAGDEMQITFKEVPPPPAGWKRDYVVIGDGWEKDGNVNTTYGQTVMPYPLHALKDYNTPPGHLEDDPAYKRNPQDWTDYHTRYVTPDNFHTALLPRRLPPAPK